MHNECEQQCPLALHGRPCYGRSDPEGRRPLAEPSRGVEGGRMLGKGPRPNDVTGDWIPNRGAAKDERSRAVRRCFERALF